MNAEPIRYGAPGAASAAFQHVAVTRIAFERVIALLRQGIDDAGLWVLHEIDPQAVLKRGGHVIGASRQILFFHPDLMIRLLEADPSALLEAPLKFAVLDGPDGTVSIRWFDPAVAFGRYRNASLDRLAADLAGICERIARKLAAP